MKVKVKVKLESENKNLPDLTTLKKVLQNLEEEEKKIREVEKEMEKKKN